MATFTVPTRGEVSTNNQGIFDSLQKGFGTVPNLYAYLAKSDTALGDYLALQNRKSTLRVREREVINLVVSQVNECEYCLAAHTALGKLNGFTDAQIIEIRKARISFDAKLGALAEFVRETAESRGQATTKAVETLFAAGYTEANLVDIVFTIGEKTISNYLHNITKLPVDFPAALPLPIEARAS